MTGPAWFWIAVAALAAGGLFSALYHSLHAMTRSTLEELVIQRSRPGPSRHVERVLADVDGHSTAVGFPRIVCNIIAALALVYWIASLRGEASPSPVDAAIGAAAASLLVWVLGLVIPHSIGSYAAEKTVYTWSWLIRACYRFEAPFNGIARFFDEVVRRLSGRDKSAGAEAIEAELLSVVEEAQEGGQFDGRERRMIEAVVDFRKVTVEQIMTPRTEIEALELTNNLGEVTRFIRHSRHSRIPVYQESLDHIVGMFYIKDLMRWLAGERPAPSSADAGAKAPTKPFELRSILRPAVFVPETKTIRELLDELLRTKVHVAMVADEYGGTSGMVTLEDIVEEIFGEIQDEYEQSAGQDSEVRVSAATRSADIDGRAYIGDANAALRSLGVSLPESEEYDTVGGLVVTRLGRIPTPGDSVQVESLRLTVTEAEPTRVGRVRLEVKEETAPPVAEEPASEPQRTADIEQRT